MQTRSLRTLVRIYQVGSFTQAAQIQNMTLSALSMQVKALEADLGAELFDRTFRPPQLTPLGRAVAEQASRVLAAEADLRGVCGVAGHLTGQFRMGFVQSAGIRILPGFLARAQVQEPGAEFSFSSGLSETLIRNVHLGQLDAAVVTRVGGTEEGLDFRTVAFEEMAIAVPISSKDIAPADLHHELPFIHFMPSTGIGRLIAAALEKTANKPEKTLVLDSIEASVECVKAGLGCTILPLPDLDRYRGARMYIHPGGPDHLKRELALVTRTEPHAKAWRRRLHSLLLDVSLPEDFQAKI